MWFPWKRKPYRVRFHGRADLTYYEGDRSVRIGSEMLCGPSGYVVYLNDVKSWDHPFEGEVLNVFDKERIKVNIQDSMKGSVIDWE